MLTPISSCPTGPTRAEPSGPILPYHQTPYRCMMIVEGGIKADDDEWAAAWQYLINLGVPSQLSADYVSGERVMVTRGKCRPCPNGRN